MEERVYGTAGHPLLCKWWVRSREVKPVRYEDGSVGGCAEFYVPLWAWPLELTHRLVFGNPKLTPSEPV